MRTHLYIKFCIISLLFIMAVLFSACKPQTLSSQSPEHPVISPTLSNSESLEAAWEQIVLQYPTNRYLPLSLVATKPADQAREITADFYVYRSARQAVLNGIATTEQQTLYVQTRTDDLRQRLVILESLSDQSTGISDILQRELQRVSTTQAFVPAHSIGEEVVCTEAYGAVTCATVTLLTNTYVWGRWDEMGRWKEISLNAARAYEILHKLDMLDSQLNLDTDRNTRLRCGNGMWFSVDTTRGFGAKDLPSIAEIGTLKNFCHDMDNRTGLEGVMGTGGDVGGWGGGLGQDNSMIENTIAEMDKWVNSCVDGPQSLVAISDFAKKVILIGAGAFLGTPTGQLGAEVLVLGILMNTPHNTMAWENQQRLQRQADEEETRRIQTELESLGDQIELYEKVAQQAEDEAARLQQDADAETDEKKKAEKQKKADEAKKKAEQARKDAICMAKSGKTCAQLEADQASGESAGASGESNEPGSGSACSDLKENWDAFKAECDRTQGWDKPGSECNEFIRRRNGCVSTTLILPLPEGDTTCIRNTVDKKQALMDACEERKKVASLASERLDLACDFPDPPEIPQSYVDICHDPAAMPGPDTYCPQEGGDIVLPELHQPFPGPTPLPTGSAWIGDGVIVLDFLNIDER